MRWLFIDENLRFWLRRF